MSPHDSAQAAVGVAEPVQGEELVHATGRTVERVLTPIPAVRRPFFETLVDGLQQRIAAVKATRLPVYLAVLAMVLAAPALTVGFAQDDLFFLSVFNGSPGLEELSKSVWSTFSFSEGDAALNRVRMERGILPWWTTDGWKVNMWRPISSLTHWVDYELFGMRAWPMHAHSLLLYGALVGLVTLLYRQIIPTPWAAGLAAFLFAVDSAHGVPVGWLANRNGLLACLFGALALLAHHQWRQTATPDRPWGTFSKGGIAALVCLTLGLLSSEGAVAFGAYVFAYALFLDPIHEPSKRRIGQSIAVLLPYLAVVIVWRAVYTGLGHGAEGSWLYVDPLTNPLVFGENLLMRYPILAFGLYGLPDSLLWLALPPVLQVGAAMAAWALLGGLVYLLWPLLRSSAPARFWFTGAALSIIPVCATVPADRNLLFAGLGAMAVVGMFLHGFVSKARWSSPWRPRWRGAARTLVAAWAICHILVAPAALAVSSYAIVGMDNAFQTVNGSVPGGAAYADKRLIVVNTPLDLLGASLPLLRSGQNQELPQSWWWLSANDGPVEVERLDDRRVVLRPEGGFLKRPYSQIFRRPSTDPMAAGDRVVLSAMTVEVLSVTLDGRPLDVLFEFDTPLESPEWVWLTYEQGAYVPFSLPAPGEFVTVPGLRASDVPRLIAGRGRTS